MVARITIGSNEASLRSQRQLSVATDALSKSTQRLSSGLRINSASDDAAGLAISDALSVRARVYGQAIRNANDGISALSIAEGGVSQLGNLTGRLRELAEQAANGTYFLSQRRAVNTEGVKLVEEFNRIVQSTSFNGLSLLDGSFASIALQLGYGANGTIAVGVGSGLGHAVGDGTCSLHEHRHGCIERQK